MRVTPGPWKGGPVSGHEGLLRKEYSERRNVWADMGAESFSAA